MITRLFLLTTVLLSGLGFSEAPPSWRFRVETLAANIPKPMHIAFHPDGRIFVSQIAGQLKLLDPRSGELTELIKLPVTNEMENGLIGLTLDPDFEKNGWIYLLHSTRDFDGQTLSRFTFAEEQIDPQSRLDILQIPEQREECCHHGGTLRFGPDGLLYISTGDNTNPFQSDGFAPIDERKGRAPWDALASSGNTNDLRGKILRIRIKADGSYEIPPGNLFPPGTAKTRPEIYAMGFRNPWRFSIDHEGTLFVGDVGPDSQRSDPNRGPHGFDLLVRVATAANFGWPLSRGGQVYRDYSFATKKSGDSFRMDAPLNKSPNNTGLTKLPPVSKPLIYYPHRLSEEFPELRTGGRCACGGPRFRFKPEFRNTGGFPEYFDGAVLFYDWQRPFIVWIRLDDEGKLAAIEPFPDVLEVAQGPDRPDGVIKVRRPSDLAFGPDGALYILDYGDSWGDNQDSRLLRVSYQWGDLAPIAKASAANTRGPTPLKVELSAKGSFDREKQPLSYQWKLLPGDTLLGTTETLTATLTEPGNFVARLTVRDPKGNTAQAEIPLIAGNSPPEVRFLSPQEGSFFTPGQAVAYEVAINDAEDGSSREKPEELGYRTLVNAHWLSADGKAPTDPGLSAMKQSDCFNCHVVDKKLIGPGFLEIAERYRGQPQAVDQAVDRIINGSSGVWGEVGMLPHPQLNRDQVHMMARWIMALKPGEAGASVTRGLTGTIVPPSDPKIRSGVIEASFSDAGNGPASSLGATATLTLRARRIQFEDGEPHGPKVFNGSGAEGRFLGSINDRHSVNLGPVVLSSSSAITIRASSGGTGGQVRLHAGSPDGPVLATVEVPATGGWDRWQEFRSVLEEGTPATDLHVVFSNPGKGGLLNVDWIHFHP